MTSHLALIKDKKHLCIIYSGLIGSGLFFPSSAFLMTLEEELHKINIKYRIKRDYYLYLICYVNISLLIGCLLNTTFLYKYNRNIKVYVLFSLILALFCIPFGYLSPNIGLKGYDLMNLCFVVLICLFSAILHGTLFGIFALFPSAYIASFLVAQSLASFLLVVIKIITVSCELYSFLAIIIRYCVCMVLIIVAMISYVLFVHNKYYVYIMSYSQPLGFYRRSSRFVALMTTYGRIIKKAYLAYITIFICYIITGAVYPFLPLNIVSTSSDRAWKYKYFNIVLTSLCNEVGNIVGRILALYIPFRVTVKIPVLASMRVLLIFLLLLCNKAPGIGAPFPNLFKADLYPIVFMLFFSLTNGYYSSLAFISVPTFVTLDKAELSNVLSSLVLGVSLLFGALLSYFISS